mmetsp:Transcript_9589/g.12598  ORF Transcript_9589/g.12598 Transcript_9589/m.12598 type:complete len:129 (+) Transcript_9589:193-579(+)
MCEKPDFQNSLSRYPALNLTWKTSDSVFDASQSGKTHQSMSYSQRLTNHSEHIQKSRYYFKVLKQIEMEKNQQLSQRIESYRRVRERHLYSNKVREWQQEKEKQKSTKHNEITGCPVRNPFVVRTIVN